MLNITFLSLPCVPLMNLHWLFFLLLFFISNRVFQIKCRYDSSGELSDLLLPPKFSYTFLFEPLLGTDRNHPGCPRVTTGRGGAAGAEFAQLKHHFQR